MPKGVSLADYVAFLKVKEEETIELPSEDFQPRAGLCRYV